MPDGKTRLVLSHMKNEYKRQSVSLVPCEFYTLGFFAVVVVALCMKLPVLCVKSCTEITSFLAVYSSNLCLHFTCRNILYRCHEVLCVQRSGGGQHKQLTLDPSILPSDTEE